MKWKWVIILVLTLSLSACGAIRKDIKKVADEDVKNYNMSLHISKEFLKTWRLNSGFIRGYLGPAKMGELPKACVDAMDELDRIAMKNPPEWNDYDLGYSLGLRTRLLAAMVVETLKSIAPDVLKYLPIF
jgi:hypothetical protein